MNWYELEQYMNCTTPIWTFVPEPPYKDIWFLVESTTFEDAMSDVISYADGEGSLVFFIDTEDEYEPGPSRSTEQHKSPD